VVTAVTARSHRHTYLTSPATRRDRTGRLRQGITDGTMAAADESAGWMNNRVVSSGKSKVSAKKTNRGGKAKLGQIIATRAH
jgi:hypothetical protein